MFCIVMFVGTLFWLFTDTGFLNGSPESSFFKPAMETSNTPRTLNQTISTLLDSGCMVLHSSTGYLGGYEQVSYEVFIREAVAARIAYRVENPDNYTVLLVETQGKTLEWVSDN